MKNGVTMSGSSDAELLEKAANNKSNSQPEMEELQIQGSPFKLVKDKTDLPGEPKKWFAAWGKGRMTDYWDTPEEVLEWIENNYWNFLITVLTMAMDSRDLYKIDRMMKQAKEHTLHMEIERLKKEEAEEYPELHELNERMRKTASK